MIDIAELTSSDTLRLPPGIAGRFRASDRFVIWSEGDTLHLKRITPRSVTDVVAEAPEGGTDVAGRDQRHRSRSAAAAQGRLTCAGGAGY